jgi:amino acid permease
LLLSISSTTPATFWRNVLADPLASATGGISQALAVFPFFAWLFLGIEAMNLASDDVPHPRRQIPIAQTACSVTLLCSGIFTLMVCVSLLTNGGMAAMISAYTPLANGFSRVFHVDPHVASIFIMPCEYASAYGLHWASAKLIHAMAASRLLPPWLGTTSKRFGTPYVAILLTSVLGYAMCLLAFYMPSATAYILSLCLLFAFSSYTGQTIGYISLRTNFPIAKHRQFCNPFGIVGAAYALAVWLLGIVAVLGFQGHHGIEALFFLVLILVLAVYYVLVAKKRQVMSEEETKILLVAHISRFNKIRKRHANRGIGKRNPNMASSNATPVSALLGSIFTSKTTNKYKTYTSTNDKA